MYNILTIYNKIPTSCKTDLHRSTVHRSIARYRTVDQCPYFHLFSKSLDIDVTMSKRRPDSRT